MNKRHPMMDLLLATIAGLVLLDIYVMVKVRAIRDEVAERLQNVLSPNKCATADLQLAFSALELVHASGVLILFLALALSYFVWLSRRGTTAQA